jgi:predicted Rdx family selenoprotein
VKAWIEARGRGPVDIEPGKTGQFDVVVDGQLAYSRHDTGRFPAEPDLLKLFP